MDHAFDSSTVEITDAGYDSLQDQILNSKTHKEQATKDIRDREPEKKERQQSKKYKFTKGDQSLELDDDYELEIMADKRPQKLTLRELRERASGDIAVKNRMHALAEEKKRVQGTFKEFANLAKTDPLAALEYIAGQANEADSEFEYQKYLEKLAEQAEKLGAMDEKERKALELEKKLKKAETDLSHKERIEAIRERQQELLSEYPEIGDRQFSQMVEAVRENEELQEGVVDEHDFMDRVEELMIETLIQKDIMSLIQEVNPEHLNDNELIFSLSDAMRANPDFDEEDARDMLRELIGESKSVQKQTTVQNKRQRDVQDERQRDMRTLSEKARQASHPTTLKTQNLSEYELLQQKLLERKQEYSKTPKALR